MVRFKSYLVTITFPLMKNILYLNIILIFGDYLVEKVTIHIKCEKI